MRLGGFVIHGAQVDTLDACLQSLGSVCDEVVAVSSVPRLSAPGVRTVHLPWHGYGAARAAAARELSGCDWLMFLDADEWLEQPARAALAQWKQSRPPALAHRLPVHDWAELGGRRFLYRTHHRARLLPRALARWSPKMIVHEALGPPEARRLPAAAIEHRFATDLSARAQKDAVYALLWAVQAQAEGRRAKVPWVQRLALFVRDALLKGAGLRGGLAGFRLAWAVAGYHSRKHQLLEALRGGAQAELAAAYAAEAWGPLFELARSRGEAATAHPARGR